METSLFSDYIIDNTYNDIPNDDNDINDNDDDENHINDNNKNNNHNHHNNFVKVYRCVFIVKPMPLCKIDGWR